MMQQLVYKVTNGYNGQNDAFKKCKQSNQSPQYWNSLRSFLIMFDCGLFND